MWALIEISGSGVLTYLHADRLGSIIATTNSSGVLVNKNTYGPYGESAAISGTDFGFTGQRYDSETGLYNYKRRYYSVATGRFLQTDPTGYGVNFESACTCGCVDVGVCSDFEQPNLNLYAYANNDPLNLVDVAGTDPGAPAYQSMPTGATQYGGGATGGTQTYSWGTTGTFGISTSTTGTMTSPQPVGQSAGQPGLLPGLTPDPVDDPAKASCKAVLLTPVKGSH